MRPDEFIVDDGPPGPVNPHVDTALIEQIRVGPLQDRDDVEVAVPLARLLHDELEAFGTAGNQLMTEHQMRIALRSLRAIAERLGIADIDIPFRDFGTFKSWWLRNDGYGSWQARRDLLHGVFEPIHDQLAVLEDQSIASTLVDPASTHLRTGWPLVDTEISELRRHFQNARTPQDYRAVGLDCVAVTEALSKTVYDPSRHLRPGETEPAPDKTKQRLERFIEDALPGSDNAVLRKVARAVIELAQQVKHSETPTRLEAGIAADSVIQLANILRRLQEPPDN